MTSISLTGSKFPTFEEVLTEKIVVFEVSVFAKTRWAPLLPKLVADVTSPDSLTETQEERMRTIERFGIDSFPYVFGRLDKFASAINAIGRLAQNEYDETCSFRINEIPYELQIYESAGCGVVMLSSSLQTDWLKSNRRVADSIKIQDNGELSVLAIDGSKIVNANLARTQVTFMKAYKIMVGESSSELLHYIFSEFDNCLSFSGENVEPEQYARASLKYLKRNSFTSTGKNVDVKSFTADRRREIAIHKNLVIGGRTFNLRA
jgi:hypothetical protein